MRVLIHLVDSFFFIFVPIRSVAYCWLLLLLQLFAIPFVFRLLAMALTHQRRFILKKQKTKIQTRRRKKKISNGFSHLLKCDYDRAFIRCEIDLRHWLNTPISLPLANTNCQQRQVKHFKLVIIDNIPPALKEHRFCCSIEMCKCAIHFNTFTETI